MFFFSSYFYFSKCYKKKQHCYLIKFFFALHFQVLRYESLRGIPLVVLANKQDLHGSISPEVLCRKLDLGAVCEGRAWFIQPCSAATGVGLEEGFRRIIYLMKTPMKQTQEDIKVKMRSKGLSFTAMKVLICSR